MKAHSINKIESIKEIYISDNEKEITDIYTGDLLSWVMGHVKNEGTILLTVLNTVNLIAVATLLDLSGIVFCEGVMPSTEVINKAKEEGINLYMSEETTFHTALKISELKD